MQVYPPTLPGHFTRVELKVDKHPSLLVLQCWKILYKVIAHIAGQHRTIRPVLQTCSGQYSLVIAMWGSSSHERAGHLPSKGKSIALAPKPFAMKYLTVSLCWKWLIKQFYRNAFMWRAHVLSQPACPYKRSRPVRIKFPSLFRNSSMPFLSIFLSHLDTQKLENPQNTLSTLN